MKIKTYKLNSIIREITSGIEGSVIMIQISLGNLIHYRVQPKRLKDDGTIEDGIWVASPYAEGKEVEEREVPTDILKTKVKDKLTGFKGMATAIVYHISGCQHIEITAPKTAKNKSQIYDFSILRCEGPAIKKLNEAEKKIEMKVRPSPSGFCSFRKN